MNDRSMNDRTETSNVSQQSASKLTRRDVLTAGLGVIGLTAFGVGGGFLSKRFFPQRLVYEFPDTVAAQGIRLVPTPTCVDDHDDPTGTFEEGPYYSKSTVVVKSCQKVYISQLRKPATDKRNRYADT